MVGLGEERPGGAWDGRSLAAPRFGSGEAWPRALVARRQPLTARRARCCPQDWRGKLGIFGVTGTKQTLPMKTMSPGFRARVVFCLMSLRNPHMLLLDEPTNPLDMDMIDSLALAIKAFSGGLVLVSHDFRLLEQVADEIWVCDEKKITPWKGDIKSYKDKLRKDMEKASKKMFTGTGVQ